MARNSASASGCDVSAIYFARNVAPARDKPSDPCAFFHREISCFSFLFFCFSLLFFFTRRILDRSIFHIVYERAARVLGVDKSFYVELWVATFDFWELLLARGWKDPLSLLASVCSPRYEMQHRNKIQFSFLSRDTRRILTIFIPWKKRVCFLSPSWRSKKFFFFFLLAFRRRCSFWSARYDRESSKQRKSSEQIAENSAKAGS